MKRYLLKKTSLKKTLLRKSLLNQSLLALVLLFAPCGSAFAGTAYSAGTELYKQRKYAEAADAFISEVKHDPNNASAIYYGAYSYYLCGKKDQAIGCFWYLARKFAARKEGIDARELLKKIDPNFLINSNNPGMAQLPTDPSAPQTASQPALRVPRRMSATEKDQVIDKMVKVVSATKDRPQVDGLFVNQMKEVLRVYPTNVLAMLSEKGCKIYVTPTILDKSPELLNARPGGYDEGQTFADCPALFNGRDIVVCQYLPDYKNGAYKEGVGTEGSMRHELGHAIDRYMGGLSRTDEFKHAYYLDSASMSPEQQAKCHYYMQVDRGGPVETFAELCCFKFGGRTDSYRTEIGELLHSKFVLCTAYINEKLKTAQ